MIMFLKYLRGRVSQIGVIIQMLGIKKGKIPLPCYENNIA